MAVKTGVLGISISSHTMAMVITPKGRSASANAVDKGFEVGLKETMGTGGWEEEITVNLKGWLLELGYKEYTATVAVSRDLSVVKSVDLPPLPPDKLARLLNVQGSDIIGIPQEDMVLTVVRSANTVVGVKHLLSAVRRREIDTIAKAIRAADIKDVKLIAETAAELNVIASYAQGCLEGDTVVICAKPENQAEVIALRDGNPVASVKSQTGRILWALETAEESAADATSGQFARGALYCTPALVQIPEGAIVLDIPEGDLGALGAAMIGNGSGCYTSDYLMHSDSPGNKADWFGRRAAIGAAVMVFVLTAFTIAMVFINNSLNAREKTARGQLKALGTQAQMVGALEQRRDNLAELGIKLKSLKEHRQPLLRALATVSEAAPGGIELTSFVYDETKGLTINAVCSGQELAKNFVTALSETKLLYDVTVNNSRWSGDGNAQSVEINVSCGLNRVVER